MSEELNEIAKIQQELEIGLEESTLDTDGSSDSCCLCKHASANTLIEVYLENKKSIDTVKTWFFNKFKRSYSDKIWNKHFNEHVEPFIKTLDVVRQKKLDELVRKAADQKRDNQFNPVTVIKQILFEILLDCHSNKPAFISSKEDLVKWNQFTKTAGTTAKVYQGYYHMELEMMGSGKTEEEFKQLMTNYTKRTIKDIFRILDDIPEAKQRLAESFGISVPNGEQELDITDVSA